MDQKKIDLMLHSKFGDKIGFHMRVLRWFCAKVNMWLFWIVDRCILFDIERVERFREHLEMTNRAKRTEEAETRTVFLESAGRKLGAMAMSVISEQRDGIEELAMRLNRREKALLEIANYAYCGNLEGVLSVLVGEGIVFNEAID